MTGTSRIRDTAIAFLSWFAAAAAGCASGPASPGHPDYPALAAEWTAVIASAGTPAELASALTGRVECAIAEIGSLPAGHAAVAEAAGRALVNLIRNALEPCVRSLPPAEDMDDGLADSLRDRLLEQVRLIELEAAERGMPALRAAAGHLRAAALILEEKQDR